MGGGGQFAVVNAVDQQAEQPGGIGRDRRPSGEVAVREVAQGAGSGADAARSPLPLLGVRPGGLVGGQCGVKVCGLTRAGGTGGLYPVRGARGRGRSWQLSARIRLCSSDVRAARSRRAKGAYRRAPS
ncbi:hypothetical protein [Actinomadura sp. WMMA1423]|uniref:hypothetical protein n=1 Tax=Actinomadura sp. WMMA1423 TaxID=2591108 RepID=UPI001147521A|nr:hypothetical protein [Actinomadura sp. WMMA1423]